MTLGIINSVSNISVLFFFFSSEFPYTKECSEADDIFRSVFSGSSFIYYSSGDPKVVSVKGFAEEKRKAMYIFLLLFSLNYFMDYPEL